MTVRIPDPPQRRRAQGNDAAGFVNPYNFVGTPIRDVDPSSPLGDHAPPSHGSVAPNTYSGVIPIRLTTRTPMLLPDQPRGTRRDDGLRTLGMRHDPAGAALLAGSTVKGVLRSAFEAITNSRYGVLDSRHQLPGAVRSAARSALELFPAVVTHAPEHPGDSGEVRYLSYLIPENYTEDTDPQPAVWLPQRFEKSFGRDKKLDRQKVFAWIHLQLHPPKGKQKAFYLWRVSDLASELTGLPPEASPPHNKEWSVNRYPPVRVAGVVHWTGAPFGRKKHDERLVVTDVPEGEPADYQVCLEEVSPELIRGWKGAIASYVAAHATETPDTKKKLGTYVSDADQWEFAVGRTMHLRYDGDKLVALTPSMIGRDVFAATPVELVDEGHLPAQERDQLSPADRVFGWVPDGSSDSSEQRPHTGHRGQLRITAPRVVGTDPSVVAAPHSPLQLATLNGPKGSQYRFYLETTAGEPIEDRAERSAARGFQQNKHRLRGRKFYLPHGDVLADPKPAYWDGSPATSSIRINGRNGFREYVAPPGSPPRVGTAITQWIPAGTTFECELRVSNLSEVELGALLWLLALPDEAVYTVGLGRPLGFGATRVQADWAGVQLFDSDRIRARYSSLSVAAEQLSDALDSQERAQRLVDTFDAVLRSTSGGKRIRAEFLDIALGFDGLPIHYPRVRDSDGGTRPKAEGFKWWVTNEREAGQRNGLPHVGGGRIPALRYLDEYVPPGRPGGNRRGGPRR